MHADGRVQLALLASLLWMSSVEPSDVAMAGRPTWCPTVPPSRYGHSLALDTGRRELIVVGGFKNTLIQDYVWAVPLADARRPRRILASGAPPPPLLGWRAYSAVYDSSGDRLIVIGGQANDIIWGEAGDDDLIGGHNVAGGADGFDHLRKAGNGKLETGHV